MAKMDLIAFTALFLSKYGSQWTSDFIAECFNVYLVSDQLDNTLDWVQPMMIDTDF